MEGYDASTYGDRFADVYDDWYADLGDVDACVKAVVELAAGGPVLELGVGTGRLAVPLAEAGVTVTGLDASPAMLDRLAAKPGGDRVEALLGDMADPPLGDRRFAAAFVAYNTFFNLVDVGDQRRCLQAVADHLRPGGRIAVEAFVPDPAALRDGGSRVEARTVTADKVVLSVSVNDPATQELSGQYVDITEAGIRLRPWRVRWATPDQLDAIATDAGLVLVDRWAGWDRTPFTVDDAAHVSVYGPAAERGDMTAVEVAIHVDATPAAVWEHLRDVAGHVEWMADADTIRFTTVQTAGAGTTFECDTRLGPLRVTDVMEITEWEPERVMGVRHTGVVTGTGAFRLAPSARGGTLLTWSEELRFPWWLGGPLGEQVGGPVLRLVWSGNLRRLAALVEADETA